MAQPTVLAAAKVKSVTHPVKDKVGSIGIGRKVASLDRIDRGGQTEFNVPMVPSSLMSDGDADHAFPRPKANTR